MIDSFSSTADLSGDSFHITDYSDTQAHAAAAAAAAADDDDDDDDDQGRRNDFESGGYKFLFGLPHFWLTWGGGHKILFLLLEL